MRKDEFPLIDAYADSKVNEVLDKIRAEIKALSPEPTAYDVVDGNPIKDAIWETLAEVLMIIDKYKGESEETETWNGIHAQITVPKGTFERIFNEADDDTDI